MSSAISNAISEFVETEVKKQITSHIPVSLPGQIKKTEDVIKQVQNTLANA